MRNIEAKHCKAYDHYIPIEGWRVNKHQPLMADWLNRIGKQANNVALLFVGQYVKLQWSNIRYYRTHSSTSHTSWKFLCSSKDFLPVTLEVLVFTKENFNFGTNPCNIDHNKPCLLKRHTILWRAWPTNVMFYSEIPGDIPDEHNLWRQNCRMEDST